MAKDDQQEAFEKVLSSNLSRAIDFIKFAETKNAALLTFSSAWIIAGVNILASGKALPKGYDIALSVALPLFVAAALMSIKSFSPRLRLSLFHRNPDRRMNLMYFGDIASMGIVAFKEQVQQRYVPASGQSATDDYLDDLMIQVAVNSQIADRKMRLFNWGSRFVLVAVAGLLIPSFWSLISWLRSFYQCL